jgi:hypothetical protein
MAMAFLSGGIYVRNGTNLPPGTFPVGLLDDSGDVRCGICHQVVFADEPVPDLYIEVLPGPEARWMYEWDGAPIHDCYRLPG